MLIVKVKWSFTKRSCLLKEIVKREIAARKKGNIE